MRAYDVRTWDTTMVFKRGGVDKNVPLLTPEWINEKYPITATEADSPKLLKREQFIANFFFSKTILVIIDFQNPLTCKLWVLNTFLKTIFR